MLWDSKWILKSRTLWINLIAVLVGWLLQSVDSTVISDPFWLLVVTSFLNILNRFFTEQSVSLLPPKRLY